MNQLSISAVKGFGTGGKPSSENTRIFFGPFSDGIYLNSESESSTNSPPKPIVNARNWSIIVRPKPLNAIIEFVSIADVSNAPTG